MTPRRSASIAVAALLAVLALCAPASGRETIYLQSGEQYSLDVTGISKDTLSGIVAGEANSFPLSSVERIDFERPREYDDVMTSDGLAASGTIFSNALSVSTEDLRERYPQAGFVILSDDTTVTLDADSTYTIEHTMAWRILEQRGADSSFQSMSFMPGREAVEILFGITVGPDGSVTRVSDSSSKVEAVYPAFPEYNYLQRLRFSMKNPVAGATLFLKTRRTGTASPLHPLVFDKVFWRTEPLVSSTVTLVASEDVLNSASIATSGGLAGGDHAMAWAVSDTPQIMPESLMPPLADFAQRLLIAYPSSSWERLASLFSSSSPAQEIRSPGAATAKDVYRKVRLDIRTVAVPQDALPNPPAAPSEVLARGYGNAVEKALLLESLLKGLGLRASTVLVRGRASGALLAEVPRLADFNHALVRLSNEDGSETWLQCEDRMTGFGELSPGVQGAPGLDLATGKVVTVPPRNAQAESTRRSISVILSADGSAVVTDNYYLRGDAARSFRTLGDMTEEELHKWAASFVGSDITGVTLLHVVHTDFNKASAEEQISFNYRVPGLAQTAGDFLIMRLPNARYSPVDVGRSTRRYDLFWTGTESEEVTFTITAPSAYSAYAVRDDASRDGTGWSLTAHYAAADSGRTLTYSETWKRDALTAPQDDYGAYREALILRGVLRNEMLVFKKARQ